MTIWANRAHPTQKTPAMIDGFNPRLNHLLTRHQKNTQILTPKPKEQAPKSNHSTQDPHRSVPSTPKVATLISDDLPSTPAHKTLMDTSAEPSVLPMSLPAPQVSLQPRFHLQGVRFGRWILLIDGYGLDDELLALWQSFKTALSNHIKHHGGSYHTHEVVYPMISANNDYKEHHHLLPAQSVCWGFLFGLGADENSVVAPLTALPEVFEWQSIERLPTLAQMLQNPALKKSLWAQVVA